MNILHFETEECASLTYNLLRQDNIMVLMGGDGRAIHVPKERMAAVETIVTSQQYVVPVEAIILE